MADMGWVFDAVAERWELHGPTGDLLAVADHDLIERVGLLQVSRVYLRRGWPALPEDIGHAPYQCVMVGGLLDGRVLYFDVDPPAVVFDGEVGTVPEPPVNCGAHAAVYLPEGIADDGRRMFRPIRVPA